MSDLIERSAVIDLIDKYTQDMSTDYWTANYGIPSGVFEDEIMDLPSAQPKQEWIPVSERLPEKDGFYIVTDDSGGAAWVNKSYYMSLDNGGVYWDYANVTAWMPLPKPYKGGGTDV